MNLRHWWANAPLKDNAPDDEIRAIDELEDSFAMMPSEANHIRRLISSLECCHFKAQRRIEHIIGAIRNGTTCKGPGLRMDDEENLTEQEWQQMADTLYEWVDGLQPDITCEPDWLEPLGALNEPSDLQLWQVRRVADRIAQYVDPKVHYYNISEDALQYRNSGFGNDRRPHTDNRAFVSATNDMQLICQTENISLAKAIDLLEPCNWNYKVNLRIILSTIAGDTSVKSTYTQCRRDLHLCPIFSFGQELCAQLRAYTNGQYLSNAEKEEHLARFGSATQIRVWLAASLEKTLRCQLAK